MPSSPAASSAPTVSANAMPPGHLPAENLDPVLVSAASTGQQNLNGAGKLCGNITASSLAGVQVPAAIPMNCAGYTMTSSILDLLVSGCRAFGFIQLVAPTQPDKEDPTVVAVGAGPPYRLSASNAGNHIVDTCKDTNGATVNLAMCLSDAAYSSYFKFATDRVIMK